MKLEICFNNLEPVSLNNSNKITTKGSFVRKYKTQNYIQLESKANLILRENKNNINKFIRSYDPDLHYIISDYKFYYPILIKSGRRISKNSKDVFNIPKTIEDCIFKYLGIDDSQVISGTSTKIQSKTPRIEVTLLIRDLRNII